MWRKWQSGKTMYFCMPKHCAIRKDKVSGINIDKDISFIFPYAVTENLLTKMKNWKVNG
jgi:hypothetical protein